ncbi:MAG: hypothetical protein AABX38_05605 [Candidatus Micrarchaeota archaeon]
MFDFFGVACISRETYEKLKVKETIEENQVEELARYAAKKFIYFTAHSAAQINFEYEFREIEKKLLLKKDWSQAIQTFSRAEGHPILNERGILKATNYLTPSELSKLNNFSLIWLLDDIKNFLLTSTNDPRLLTHVTLVDKTAHPFTDQQKYELLMEFYSDPSIIRKFLEAAKEFNEQS